MSLHVSNPRVHLQDDGCIYTVMVRYGMLYIHRYKQYSRQKIVFDTHSSTQNVPYHDCTHKQINVQKKRNAKSGQGYSLCWEWLIFEFQHPF